MNICPICKNETKRKVFCSRKCFYSEEGKKLVKEKREQTNIKICGHKNFFQSLDIKKQIEEIHFKNLGVKHPQQSLTVQKKTQKTCESVYGNKFFFASDMGKKKIADINLEKGGNVCSLHSKEGAEKTRKTWNKKYIGGHPFRDPIIRGKIRQKIIPKLKEIHKKITKTTLINSFKKFLSWSHVGPLFSEIEYTGGKNKQYPWRCNKCLQTFYCSIASGNTPICRNCNPVNIYDSKKEEELRNWLSKYHQCFKKRFYEKGKFKYELDIFIPSKNIGIEFNGTYSHSEKAGNNQNYHLNKTEYFKKKNIHVIHIWEHEWNKYSERIKSFLLKELIAEKFENCLIKEISLIESNKFLELNHIEGSCDSNVQLGLFHNQELMSVMALKNNIILRWFTMGFNEFLSYIKYSKIIVKNNVEIFKENLFLENGFYLIKVEEPKYFTIYKYKIWDCGSMIFEYHQE